MTEQEKFQQEMWKVIESYGKKIDIVVEQVKKLENKIGKGNQEQEKSVEIANPQQSGFLLNSNSTFSFPKGAFSPQQMAEKTKAFTTELRLLMIKHKIVVTQANLLPQF